MARYYVKRPDGKWNIFSTIVDDYVVEDATIDEIKEFKRKEFEEQLNEEMNRLLGNGRPLPNIMSYEEAEETIKLYHSSDEEE